MITDPAADGILGVPAHHKPVKSIICSTGLYGCIPPLVMLPFLRVCQIAGLGVGGHVIDYVSGFLADYLGTFGLFKGIYGFTGSVLNTFYVSAWNSIAQPGQAGDSVNMLVKMEVCAVA